jgi:hypothetical protein
LNIPIFSFGLKIIPKRRFTAKMAFLIFDYII